MRGLGDNDLPGQVRRVYDYVRKNVVYIRDPVNAEYVISPIRMLSQIRNTGYSAGDCDDHTMLLNTMLGSIGFPTKFVGVKQGGSPRFNHVVSAVKIGPNMVLLDPCAKTNPTANYQEQLTV
jgi:transglutaminase-like putative cysteine protease